MIRLSRRVLETIEAVVDVAYYGGGVPVRSSQIAERNNIPSRYLESTLQVLVRKGILTSTRGPNGGFRLARERTRVTLYQIYDVVRGLEAEEDPINHFVGKQESPIGTKVLVPLWGEYQDLVLEEMKKTTVDDLCRRAREAGIKTSITEMVEEDEVA